MKFIKYWKLAFILIIPVPFLSLISCTQIESENNSKVIDIEVKNNPLISYAESKQEINIFLLKKIFNNINEYNFNNFSSTWSPAINKNQIVIILTPKDDFYFKNKELGEVLKSEKIIITLSDIKAKNPEQITGEDLINPINIKVVQKLFFGINEETFNLILPSWKLETPEKTKIMILTTKDNFTFDKTSNFIESLPINVPIKNKVLTREIVLENLKKGGSWDNLVNGDLLASHLNGYTEIGDGAFKDIQKIRDKYIFTIEIPNTITKIGKEAFACEIQFFSNDIRFITFEKDSKLEVIEELAFSKNQNLKEIIFPSSLKSIGDRAFELCNKLVSSFDVMSNLESIGNLSFQTNDKLSKLVLPSKLKSIGYNAFSGCNGLTEISIPISVKSIGKTPFLNTLFAVIKKISIPKIFENREDKLGLENDAWSIVTWIS